MFQPHLWSSSGRIITRDILQKRSELMHKYKIPSFKMCGVKYVLKYKIQINFIINSNV